MISSLQIYCVLSCLIASVPAEHQCLGYPPALCNSSFSDPRLLRSSSDNVIHIGVSLKIINKNNNREKADDFESGFKADIMSLFGGLLELSSGATQHWIILTDEASVESVCRVVRGVLTRHLTYNIIKTYEGRRKIRRVPKVIFDFIDLESIAKDPQDELFIKTLQSFMMKNLSESGLGKYMDKLFYTGPLYHRIFPSLNKLIFMDVGKAVQTCGNGNTVCLFRSGHSVQHQVALPAVC